MGLFPFLSQSGKGAPSLQQVLVLSLRASEMEANYYYVNFQYSTKRFQRLGTNHRLPPLSPPPSQILTITDLKKLEKNKQTKPQKTKRRGT